MDEEQLVAILKQNAELAAQLVCNMKLIKSDKAEIPVFVKLDEMHLEQWVVRVDLLDCNEIC